MLDHILFNSKKWVDEGNFPLFAQTQVSSKTLNQCITFQIKNGVANAIYETTTGYKVIVSPKIIKVKADCYGQNLGELNLRQILLKKNNNNEDWGTRASQYPDSNVYIADDSLTDLKKVTSEFWENGEG